MKTEQLWLELPPISAQAPRRLLVFLHGAGSSPEIFAPVAVTFHLKFPGATGAILQGLLPTPWPDGRDWFDARADADRRRENISAAVLEVTRRIGTLQEHAGVGAEQTVLIGFSQGATIALEVARHHPEAASIVVAYAGRLAGPIRPEERIGATVHLIHGEVDTLVPVEHARQALRGLRAAGANVTLDVIAEGAHSIGQQMIILGTTRVMQSVFRGRTSVRAASNAATNPGTGRPWLH